MGEHLEPEIGILVQHLQAARDVIAAIGLDELPIGEELLEVDADLLPALGPGVALENGAAVRHERIEVVRHCCLLADAS